MEISYTNATGKDDLLVKYPKKQGGTRTKFTQTF